MRVGDGLNTWLSVIFGSKSLRYTEVYIACKDEV